MGSSFTTFLNEGLIKLPQSVLDKMIEPTIYWYLTRLEMLSLEEKQHEPEDIKAGIEAHAKHQKVPRPSDKDLKRVKTLKTLSAKIKLDDIPESYIKSVGKTAGKAAVSKLEKNTFFTFTIAFERPARMPKDSVGLYISTTDEIIILIDTYFTSVERGVNELIGRIEHELTHAIQDMVLYKIHVKQFDVNDKKLEYLDSNDEYYMTDVEFDPQIKTAIKRLKNILSTIKDPKEKRDMVDKFVFADVPKNKVKDKNEDYRSFFFRALRLHDDKKWKKAVKLIMKEFT